MTPTSRRPPTRAPHRSSCPGDRIGRAVAGLSAAAALAVLIGGVPWAASRWVGWPLPDHVPSWAEVEAVLSQPATTGLVVDMLACIGWLIWAAFMVEVARAAFDAVRAVRDGRPLTAPVRPVGWYARPLHAAAAALVGTVLLTLLGNQAVPAERAPATGPPGTHIAAAAGPALVDRPLAFAAPAANAGVPAGRARLAPAPLSGRGSIVVVRAASRGIHDSLWRIADRELGDGARWPDLYRSNKGRLQPDGRRLSSPNLIYPGWHLVLPNGPRAKAAPTQPRHDGGHRPDNRTTPTPPPTPAPAPPAGSAATPDPTATGTTATPAPSAPATGGDTGSPNPAPATPPADAGPSPGVELPGGGYVGLGLAAMVAAALLSLRAWRRSNRDDPTGSVDGDADFAPVIRAFRWAYDTPHLPDPHPLPASHHVLASPQRDADFDSDVDSDQRPDRPASSDAPQDRPGGEREPVGVRGGNAQVIDLARTRGLGLIGPGAPDAARALLAELLARRHQPGAGPVEVLVPADTLAAVLPDVRDRVRPTRLRVGTDLDTVLDAAEVELVTRARLTAERRASLGTLVLLVTPQPHAQQRLQAVLDNGSTLDVIGILLGQWRPGGTVRIRADGTVAAASPDVADVLDGTRLFILPAGHTADLLDLLAAADPAAADREGTTSPDEPDPDTDPDGTDPDDTDPDGTDPAGSDRGSRAGSEQPVMSPVTLPDTAPVHDRMPRQPSGPRVPPTGRRPRQGSEAAPPDTGTPAPAPLRLEVLGRLHLHYRRPRGNAEERQDDLIAALAPRQREILVYLALHRDGARREALAAAMWPDAPAERPYNSFHATLSQLRRTLAKASGGAVRELTLHADGHYRLDPELVDVDLWQLRDTLAATRATGPQRLPALRRVPILYAADLAADLGADWLTGARETLRRDVLDAISTLIRVDNDDPQHTLIWLEHARTLDPYNEALYRTIIRVQARLGQHDTITRTMTLLKNTLAEIDLHPDAETETLAQQLGNYRSPRPIRGGAAAS